MKCVVSEAYRQYADFIDRIPQLFAQGEGTVIYRQRNEVRRMEYQGKTFIVKCYKKVNPIQQVVYTFFRKTKAERYGSGLLSSLTLQQSKRCIFFPFSPFCFPICI
jgi:hypothetical protein